MLKNSRLKKKSYAKIVINSFTLIEPCSMARKKKMDYHNTLFRETFFRFFGETQKISQNNSIFGKSCRSLVCIPVHQKHELKCAKSLPAASHRKTAHNRFKSNVSWVFPCLRNRVFSGNTLTCWNYPCGALGGWMSSSAETAQLLSQPWCSWLESKQSSHSSEKH